MITKMVHSAITNYGDEKWRITAIIISKEHCGTFSIKLTTREMRKLICNADKK